MSSDVLADPIEEQGVGAKLERISHIISRRLGNAVSEAQNVSDSEISADGSFDGLTGIRSTLRPWLDGKSPINAFSDAERARHANARVMDTLVRHLTEHVVIDQELQRMSLEARRRASDELRDIPLSMIDFVNRLMASGVVARDVRFMPRARLAEVVAVIRGVDAVEALAMVPDNLPVSTWSDVGDGSSTGADELGGGHAHQGSDGLIGSDILGVSDGASTLSQDVSEAPPEPVIDSMEQTGPDMLETTGEPIDETRGDAMTRNDVGDPSGTRNDGVEPGAEAVAIRPVGTGSNDGSDAPENDDSVSAPGTISDTSLDNVGNDIGAAGHGVGEPGDGTTSRMIEPTIPEGDAGHGDGSEVVSRHDAELRDRTPVADLLDLVSAPPSEAISNPPVDDTVGIAGGVGGAPDMGDGSPIAVTPQATGGGLWDVIDVSHTGYRIEEHVIGSDADVSVMRMVLPTDRSMSALAMPKGLEATLATGAEEQGDGGMAQRFVGRYCLRTGMEMTEEERRAWLFLLFEARTPSENRQLGRTGFFDGVRLPGRAGTTKVRQLVAVDRDRLADAPDPSILSGPATHRR